MTDALARSDGPAPRGYGFGTFKGVFTPSLLTILGVIMYLRLPWVVGSVGLWPAVLIITMAVAITLLTGLSIAALATNMRIGGGGAYYMISRSLGLEAGAAVGLPLFLAQSLGVSFYVAGFTEVVIGYFPDLSPLTVGVATLMALTLLAYASADLALKSQFAILALLIASLVSLFAGAPPLMSEAPVGDPLPAAPFWVTFAVFFPAVTGIEAGLGMSGDLARPERSLPRGTLAAILVGYLVYLAIPVFLAAVVEPNDLLLADTLIVTRVARWPEAIIVGILGATLSSALGALLGAPRTLQSLAQDAVLPRVIGRGFGARNDPRLATVIAFAIALVGITLGNLNAIAPVLSMFFLTSYAVLNLSAAIEGAIAGPAWRPSFRVPWWVSLLGFFACVGAMLMIDAGATFVAAFASVLVYHAVQRRRLTAQWGDVRYGALVLVARLVLEQLARKPTSARSWNPNVLVLSGALEERWHLVVIGRALAGEGGLLTVAAVVDEEGPGFAAADRVHREIEDYLVAQRVPALVKVQTDADTADGMIALVKSYGFGPLVPNTILLGKASSPPDQLKHAELLSLVQRQRRNLVIVHEGEGVPTLRKARRIDLWWKGHGPNLGLMLALTFLLRRTPAWEAADVMVWRIVENEADVTAATAALEEAVAGAQFATRVQVVVRAGEPFDTIGRHCGSTDLLFLGLRPRAAEESMTGYAAYYHSLTRRTRGFPPTILVTAGEPVDLQRLFAAR